MENLKIDKLLSWTKEEFSRFRDKRASNSQYPIGDVVQSGLAMFSLKDSSLLEYNNRVAQRLPNLNRIYKIENCPPDSQMRRVLDKVGSIQIERVKRKLIYKVKEAGLLEEFQYFKGYYLLAIDGVHHFSSKEVSCSNCLHRTHEDGSTTYSHSMLAAVIVHPSKRVVLPLCEEAIVHQDGETKNDCELNASKRLLEKVRTRHMDLKFIRVEDALYANGPHIKSIQENGDKYIITVKPGSGAGSVIEQYEALKAGIEKEKKSPEDHKLFKLHGIKKPMSQVVTPQIEKLEIEINLSNNNSSKNKKGKNKEVIKAYYYVNGLYLNESHKDIKVHFLHYIERCKETGKILKQFQWITNIELTAQNVQKVEKAARARWKIENETFNTLKNQGYNFEHNYGHGEENLCTNFALLMILAFLIDQIQQLSNEVFQQTLEHLKWKKYLWEDIRSFFRTLPFGSMEHIYKAIVHGVQADYLSFDTS